MTGLFADSGRMHGHLRYRAAGRSRNGNVTSLSRGVHCSAVDGSVVLFDRYRVCPPVRQETRFRAHCILSRIFPEWGHGNPGWRAHSRLHPIGSGKIPGTLKINWVGGGDSKIWKLSLGRESWREYGRLKPCCGFNTGLRLTLAPHV